MTYLALYLLIGLAMTNIVAVIQHTTDGFIDDVGLARTFVLWPTVVIAVLIATTSITLRCALILSRRLYYTIKARIVSTTRRIASRLF